MSQGLTIEYIDTLLSNLSTRNQNSPKFKLFYAIRQFYQSARNIGTIRKIETDRLIPLIWNVDSDPDAIKARRKNFNSIKSSINTELMALYDQGRNPDGFIIGPENTFVISDKARDNLLNTFTSSVDPSGLSLQKVAEVLKLISEFVSSLEHEATGDSTGDIHNLKDILDQLARKLPLEDSEAAAEDEEADEVIEVVEVVEEDDPDDGSETLEEIDEDEFDNLEEADPNEPDDGSDAEDEVVEEIVEVLEEDEPDAADDDSETLEEIDEDEYDSLQETDPDEDDEAVEIVEVLEEDEPDASDDDSETLEEIDEDEYDSLQETDPDQDDEPVEIVEVLEEDEPDAADDDSEVLEEIDEDEFDILEAEDLAEEPEDDPEPDVGLPMDNLGEDEFAIESTKSENEKNRLLSEAFDGYLGAMERYYNQYLLIPSGRYKVGSPHPRHDEPPQQSVALPDFYFGKYPVTNSLFEIFIERTGYKTTAEESGFGIVYTGRFQKIQDEKSGLVRSVWNAAVEKKTVEGACWYQPSGPGSNLHNKKNHPVVQVSLVDAMTFAAWVGKRLPSEFEWEAASRTSSGNQYPWGNEWKNEAANIEDTAVSDTTPVDRYVDSANEFGICDCLGNVLEWTSDKCSPPYPVNHDIQYYVAKGGSWISEKNPDLTARFRFEKTFTSNILGFRCLVDF